MTRKLLCSRASQVLRLFNENAKDIPSQYLIKYYSKPRYIKSLNNAITHQRLTAQSLRIKQSSKKFSLTSNIKYCISPHPAIEVWFTFCASETEDNSLTPELLNTQIESVYVEYQSLFEHRELTDALIENGIIYAKAHNFSAKLKKVSNRLYANKLQTQRFLDIPELFPTARRLKRKIVVFAGETSCGKTYNALNLLKAAHSGQYLAPLRLNALETFDDFNGSGVPCDLITGDEKCLIDNSKHQACTAEIASFDKELGAVVIDEAQFMDDEDRGWAFCNAIIGAPSKIVMVTCPEYAVEKVERLAGYLDDEVQVIKLPRKTKLTVTPEPRQHFFGLQKSTAIIAFSRKRIFQLKQQLESHYKISVIYGGMPPEVRREQARRFREGETELLIATDALGIGLNLPIKHIILDTITKFDGKSMRILTQAEVLQIVGRAGRYKIFDEGYVSGRNCMDHAYIKECLGKPNETTLTEKFYAKIPFSYVKGYMLISEEQTLSTALKLVHEKTTYDEERYELAPIDQLLDNLRLVESQGVALELDDIWRISHIPIDLNMIEATFLDCLLVVSGISKGVSIDVGALNSHYLDDGEKLTRLEALSVQIDCISWFLLRYEPSFDINLIGDIPLLRKRVNTAMNNAVMKK